MTKKDFTIRKRLNRGKLIAGMTACFFALTSLLSCVNQIDDFNESNAAYSGEIIQVRGKIITDGAVPSEVYQSLKAASAARSAVPSIPATGYEYFIEGSDNQPENVTFESDGTYTISLLLNTSYSLTAGFKKTDGTKVLESSAWNIKPTRSNAGSDTLKHDFFLEPVEEGNGNIYLLIKIPSEVYSATVTCNSAKWANSTTTPSISMSTDAGTFLGLGVPCGKYEVSINFYNSINENKRILLYSTVQTITVLNSLDTDTWTDSGSSASIITNPTTDNPKGEFKLTSEIINSFQKTQIYVGNTRVGTASDSGSGSPYSPFNAVGKALDLIKTNNTASNDYTIWISGSFTGNLSLDSSFNSIAHKLTFCGLSELNDGIPQDVIKGTGTGSVLTINTSVPVELKNVKITGGNAPNGGGIYMGSGSKVTLADGVLLTDNKCPLGDGGGIYCDSGSSLTLCGTAKVSKNTGKGSGGGIALSGASLIVTDSASIEENKIQGSGWGGGVCANGEGSSITISGNAKFIKNEGIEGGAIGAIDCSGGIRISGGTFSGNTATQGGAIRLWSTPLTMTGGTFENNSATSMGGALCMRSTTEVTHSISGNAYIPYGVTDAGGTLQTGAGKNDIYLGENRVITLSGSLNKHSKTNPIAITTAWDRGLLIAQADVTNVTDLTPYKDYFVTTDSVNWLTKLSADKKQITLDAPIYVSTSGSSAATTKGTKNDPFRTIQDAISTALTDTNVDYTILIDGELRATTVDNNGTTNGYAQEIIDPPAGSTIKAKSITIRGASASNGNPTDFINGLSADGTKRARGLFIGTKIPVTIENLKITGGLADEGGGIYLSGEDTTLTLGNDVLITGNKAKNSGGGIYLTKNNNSCPTLNIKGNVKICDNTNSVSGDPSNLYLPEGAKITVTGALTKGSNMAKIGISTGSEPSLTSRVTFTIDYGLYNSDTAPGTYFTGDKWNVAWESGTSSNEAALAASGGNITIEPVYEDITINVDKSSVLKSATEKKFTFSANGTDSEGNTNPITIGSGEGQLALSVDSVTYHGETVPASYYGTGIDYVTLGNSLPAGNYTINTKAVYKGSLSEARTYSPSFDVVIKEYLGSKKSTDSKDVGDIVFNDGSAMPYSEFSALDTASKNELKTKAIALIFYKGTDLNKDYDDGTPDATTVRTLGVGLKQYQDCFCTAMANAYNENIATIQCTFSGSPWNYSFTGDKNGSDNYDQIADFLGSNNDTESISSYCAFNNAVNYKDGKLSSENMTRIISNSEYASGWYFPSIAELFWIYKNGKLEEKVFDIDEAIAALGGDKFENNTYMSSSQSSNTAKNIYTLTSSGCSQIEKNEGRKQCCYIREF